MDLTTKTFQVLPHSAHADDWVDVLFNIQNNKDTLIEGVKVKFYLSRNSWISTGDYEIGSYDIHSIAGGVPSGMLKTSLHLPPAHDKFWLDDKNATYFIGPLIENNNAIDLGSSSAYRQFLTHDAIDIKDLYIPVKGDHFSVSSFTQDADGNIKADIDFSLFNHGDGHADKFKVDFYISNETDNRRHPISTDDYFIGSHEVGGLESGHSTGVIHHSFNLPHGFDDFWEGSGYYSLGMIINEPGETYESHRFNKNSNQKEGLDYSINTIFQESWVDLHAVEFNVRQEDVKLYKPGQNLLIDYGIRNGGLGYLSQDFNLHFYVSTDPDINTNDIYIGSERFTDDLSAGKYGRGTVDLILPDHFPAINDGRYYVGVIVDGDNEVKENNEVNNFNTGELLDYDGTGGALDGLHNIVTELTNSYFNLLSGDYKPGGTVHLEYSAANLSHVRSDGFNVKFYLSNNEYISTNDIEIGSYDFTDGLDAYSKTGMIDLSLTLPSEDHPFWKYNGNGSYFFGAIIDPGDANPEYKESNNANMGYKFDSDVHAISGINVADLYGSHFAVYPSHGGHRTYPGQAVDIAYQITNQEVSHSGPFNVEFYLSSNPYISPNDYKIGEQLIKSGVHGFSHTGINWGTYHLPDASHEIWSNFDGTYYLGMIIDGAHQVVEMSHKNNQNQGQYLDSDTVEVVGTHPEKGADLVGASLHLVDHGSSEHNPVEAGDHFKVEYSVLNTGSGDAPFFGNNFYIATEDFVKSHQPITNEDLDSHSLYGLVGDFDSFLMQLGPYDHTGTKEITLQLPHNVSSAGKHYLVMQTDDYDEVQEPDEFNNIHYVEIYLDGPADLFNQHLAVLDNVSEDNPLQPGEIFSAEYEVVNKGGEDVPFSATHFYLLTEDYLNEHETINVEDIDSMDLYALYGDEFTEVISLEAGETTGKQEISLQIPDDIEPGKYFLGIQSDLFEEVEESNELNNSLFAPVEDHVEIHIGDVV